MTDLEKFVELYRSFGIECVVSERERYQYESLPERIKRIRIGNWEYGVPEENTDSDKFDGYGGFYSEVIFDMDGKFIKQTFYE